MSSANFTFDDVIQSVREQLNDDAARRHKDTDILNLHLPLAYQQLYADRPDLFLGLEGTVTFKPSQDAPLPFDDAGFHPLVEAVLASVMGKQKEDTNRGSAAAADARSERARRK